MYLKKSLTGITLLLFIFIVLSVQSTTAQTDQSDSVFQPSFSVSGSYAPFSFQAWGKMLNSRHLFLKLGYSHSEHEIFSVRTQLSSELIVTGWLKFPIDGRNGDRESLYGFGMIPLIATMPLQKGSNYPFLTSSLGFIVTQHHFPTRNGARFNFLLGTGAGYHFKTGSENSFQIGYKIHHLSNGYMATENPGIDSIMLFVNFSFNP
ncbi:acyloxyacyl hydrolase [Rhodohalobacter sp.]|uniref:acyloxyacyl hydrolase n=1 Tax=Rhodohalobacter sp. TaxID=1974210 RepID=UPI002ACD2717|nr:acyloxyacyl hydrolase [Rhodohalobacter sp.]MDZ7757661.1 acyloxyacyl hydrolase [Rhodohalobacter sp.]